jgi:hypothetical protein
MPDTKISALTDGTTAEATDRIPVARDAGGGTFNNRYVTPGYIGTTLLGSGSALTGATVTTSQPVLNLSQTWNAGAVTFTGLKFNATDTASASGSLLLDLQVGAVSQFNLSKSGVATFAAGAKTSPTVKFSGLNGGFYGRASGFISVTNGNVEIGLMSGNGTSFLNNIGLAAGAGSGGDLSVAGADLILSRAAAATLQLGAADAAAPVAQTLQVQGVVAGTSNTAGGNFTINGSRGTGTGAGGSIIFQVSPAGSSGTAQNAYATALTIESAASAGSNARLTLGSGNTGVILTGSGPFSTVIGYNGLGDGFYGVLLGSTARIGFTSTNAYGGSADTILARDAANTLALRNSTNAQTFRVYNTYNGTNDEWGTFDWSTTTNTLTIGATKSGTGTVRSVKIVGGNTGNQAIILGQSNNIDLQAGGSVWLSVSATGVSGWINNLWTNASAWTIGSASNEAGASNRAGSPIRIQPKGGSGDGAAAYIELYTGLATSSGTTGHTSELAVRTFLPATGNPGIQFGGTTSSFPALKRSSTTLQVRLADDSALTNIEALNLTNGRTIQKFTPLDNQPPASNFATLDTRNSIAVLDFDDTTAESAVFVGVISAGAILTSGISVRIHWMATSATSGDCRWSVAFEDMNTDLDTDSFDTATAGNSAANGTSGVPSTLTLTCTTIDSLVAGDFFRIKVTRDAANGGDTMTGDAELIAVEIRQVA